MKDDVAGGGPKMRGSIRVVVAAAVALLGLGSPAQAAPGVQAPGIGDVICDGFTGTCTNPIYFRTVVLRANEFSPVEGGPPTPRLWTVGRVKLAESQEVGATDEVFAVGHLRVRPFGAGFISFSTVAWGRFLKNDNPDWPYRFEGIAISHDPEIMRNQDFEFIGEQLADPPPPPKNRNDR